MINSLGVFLGTLTGPLTEMGTKMGYNWGQFNTATAGQYQTQTLSTVAFSVFGSAWVAASGPIVVGLSTFLTDIVTFLKSLSTLL